MARIDDEYAKAVERYTQSLAIKSDFYEASIAWGQQAFERGKVLHVASKSGDDAEAKGKLAADADAMFALAEGKFQESLGMIPKEEAEASTSGDAAAPAEEGLSLKSQILVLWGNVLFERSQVKHHRDAGDSRRTATRRWPSSGRGVRPGGHRARAYEPHLGEVGGGEGRRGGGWEEVSDGT